MFRTGSSQTCAASLSPTGIEMMAWALVPDTPKLETAAQRRSLRASHGCVVVDRRSAPRSQSMASVETQARDVCQTPLYR